MAGEIAVRADGLAKRYRLGQLGGYGMLRDVITDRVRRRPSAPRGEEFWALRDVSFELEKGQTMGILGRNGAGKSTLLKVLSRVTPPTAGRATIHGRVGTLLEVGTGFHPELTGRENISLNGAVLGMRREEIIRKFDEIVEFAGVERFIDTPVKRYSSGMYLRLAFSVAAHLEPEILIVDEVLAVGDAAFQRKCLGKMSEVSQQGRTVIFVSHNTAAVENLCRTALVLDAGRVVYDGPVADAIHHYMTDIVTSVATIPLADRTDRRGNGDLWLTAFRVEDKRGNIMAAARSGEDCVLAFDYETKDGAPVRDVVASFALQTTSGAPLILHRTNFTGQDFETVPPRGTIRCAIDRLPLVAGNYLLGTYIEVGGDVADDLGICAELPVEPGDFFGTGHAGLAAHSPILVDGQWSVRDGS
ncbi:MAG: transporter related protein [Solirubrobacterales bacterium]|nr:transporter related protein [Solirubrobacterales bacterium]